jgi:hypothetical protein
MRASSYLEFLPPVLGKNFRVRQFMPNGGSAAAIN